MNIDIGYDEYGDLLRGDKSISHYSLNGQEYIGKCIKVYDGDTITAVFKTKELNKLYKYTIRLAGIDTPELKSINSDEKNKGYMVRDFLRGLILDKLIYIKCGEFDKYGRLLATISLTNIQINEKLTNMSITASDCINDLLISKGYAYKYDGGTKEIFKNV